MNETNSDFTLKTQNIKALILAAGEGRRMRPLTDCIPKPFLPLLNKSLVNWNIAALQTVGIPDIGVVIPPYISTDLIVNFTGNTFVQQNPLGMGAAILEAKEWLDSTSFRVCAGDSVFPEDFLKKMLEFHISHEYEITMATEFANHEEMTSRSCVLLDEDGFVEEIKEKPRIDETKGDLAAAPIYIFKQSFLTELSKISSSHRGEYEVQSAIQSMIEKGNKVGRVHSTRWIHLSEPKDLYRINFELLQKNQSIDPSRKNETFIPPFFIDKSVKIGKKCILGPSVIIGKDTTVNNDVRISNLLVLPNSVLSESLSRGIAYPGGFLPIRI